MNATVRLDAATLSFEATDAVVVRVTITNPGDRAIGILRWFTPADGVERPLFTVRRDGAPVPYVGRMVKRTAPTNESYLTLEPAAAVTSEVDLAALYPLATPGRYEVVYDATSPELYVRDAGGAPSPGELRSAPLRFTVTARTPPPRP